MSQSLATTWRLLLLAVMALPPNAGVSRAADRPRPTREAFLGEVLDAKPTPATPEFNDYSPSSYHVRKEDLLKGLIDEAKNRKLTLRAVLIAGPMPDDPLWTYHVAAFIQEGDKVRVNSLVMPHARITGKFTGRVTSERLKKWLDEVLETGLPRKEPPPQARNDKAKDGPLDDFGYHLLLAAWDAEGKTRQLYYGSLRDDEKKVERFKEQCNSVLKELKKTYPE
jgi:hypothetical protein